MKELLELKATPKEWISPSQLTMLRRCPKQFEFRYVKEIKLPPPFAVALGTATHLTIERSIIDDYIRKNVRDFFYTTIEEMEEAEEFRLDENENKEEEIERTIAVNELYIDNELSKFIRLKEREIEKEIDVKLDSINKPLKIILDLETKKKVYDWKLGKYKRQDFSTFQMKLYHLATNKPVQVHYLVRKKTPEYQIFDLVKDYDDKVLIEEVNKLILLMKTGIFYRNPGHNYMNCKWCGYREICKPI